MNYSISTTAQKHVLRVDDLLNEYANRELLREVTDRLNDQNNHLVVDLSDMAFMNSVGLNFLIAARRYAQQLGGDLSLAAPSRNVRQLLEVTRLATIFRVVNSVHEA